MRALDAGTLSLSRLARLLKGADLTILTDPIAKQEQLAKMAAELKTGETTKHPPRKRRGHGS